MDLEIIILSEVKDNYIASYMWNLFFFNDTNELYKIQIDSQT